MEKLIKTSNVINKLLSVLFILTILVGVVGTVMSSVTAFSTDAPNTELAIISFKLGNVELFLQDDFLPSNFRAIYTYSLALTILSTLSGCYMIILLKRIFKPMALGLPFDSAVGVALSKLAWSVLIFGILYTVLQAAMETTYFHILDLANLMVGEHIKAVELNIVADGSFLIGFVILLLLSYVFRYGTQLQQLSDETL